MASSSESKSVKKARGGAYSTGGSGAYSTGTGGGGAYGTGTGGAPLPTVSTNLTFDQIPSVRFIGTGLGPELLPKVTNKHPSNIRISARSYNELKTQITTFLSTKELEYSLSNSSSEICVFHPHNRDATFAIICRTNYDGDTWDVTCEKKTEHGKFCEYSVYFVDIFDELKGTF